MNKALVGFIIEFNKFVNFQRMFFETKESLLYKTPYYFSFFLFVIFKENQWEGVCFKTIFKSLEYSRKVYIRGLAKGYRYW